MPGNAARFFCTRYRVEVDAEELVVEAKNPRDEVRDYEILANLVLVCEEGVSDRVGGRTNRTHPDSARVLSKDGHSNGSPTRGIDCLPEVLASRARSSSSPTASCVQPHP